MSQIGMTKAVSNPTYFFDPNSSKQSGGSPLRSKHSNISINQALTDFDEGELCPIHRGEPVIAIDDADHKKYGCNKCVFEKQLARPRFLAHQAK